MSITRVQEKSVAINAAANTVSLTLTSSPTDGNFLVITVNYTAVVSSGSLISGIAQTGATWQKAIAENHAYGRDVNSEIWYAMNVAGATGGITVSFTTGSTNLEAGFMVAAEYSGVATTSALDKTAFNTATGVSSIDCGTTATTTQANELWIGACCGVLTTVSGVTLTSPTNSFTVVDSGQGANGGISAWTVGGLLEKIVSSTGAANTAATPSDSSTFARCGAIATFKASGSTPVANGNFFMFM